MDDADFRAIIDRIRFHSDQLPSPDQDALAQAGISIASDGDPRRAFLLCLDVLREIAMLRSSAFAKSVTTTMRRAIEKRSPPIEGVDLLMSNRSVDVPGTQIALSGSESATWLATQISRLQDMLLRDPYVRQESLRPDEWIAEVDVIFSVLAEKEHSISQDLFEDKMYQAWALANVLLQLHALEGFSFRPVNGKRLLLKEFSGPIDQSHPYFEGRAEDRCIALWPDVRFQPRIPPVQNPRTPLYTDEPSAIDRSPTMNIAIVSPSARGYPSHDEILWAVACRRAPLQEDAILSAIHLRHALSALSYPTETFFHSWPATRVPAEPPTAVTIFSTGLAATPAQQVGEMFGIGFEQLGLPV